MAKNHWNAKSPVRQEAYKYGYKSGLEHKVADALKEINYPVNYETETLKYVVPESKHKYTPDFVLTKKDGSIMFIETKGRWTSADRLKMKHVLKSNPDIDIRIVFQNGNQKISKGSKTTYEMYANKLGIMKVANKMIPVEWLAECCQVDESPTDPKTFFNF